MDGPHIALLIGGCIVFALGVVLAVRGRRDVATLAVALILTTLGVGGALRAFSPDVPTEWRRAWSVGLWFDWSMMAGAMLLFAATFAPHGGRRWRRALAGFSIAPVLLAVAPVAALVAGDDDLARALTRPTTYVYDVVSPLVTLILGVQFLRAPPGDRRTRLLFALLPFATWQVYAGAGLMLMNPVPSVYFWLGAAAAAVAVVLAAGVMPRPSRMATRRQDLVLLAGLVAALALPAVRHGAQEASFALLLAELQFVFLFYGVARYQFVGVDFRLRSLGARTTQGAVALPVFLVTQQAAQEGAGALGNVWAGSSPWISSAVAAILAGLALFSLDHLQRFLKRGSPDEREPASLSDYQAHRRIEVYRSALAGALEDGQVAPRESRTLASLRSSLRITPSEHEALERDLRSAALG